MKRIATCFALAAILSIGAFGGVASATSTTNGEAPYNVQTGIFGLVQCANWSTELGEGIAPPYLYVTAVASRTKGVYCSGGPYNGNAQVVARVNYRLMAWTDGFGGLWYPCWDWDTVVKNGANQSYAADVDVRPGCGATYYYVQSYVEVAMDPGDGVMYWYGHFTMTPNGYAIWMNG